MPGLNIIHGSRLVIYDIRKIRIKRLMATVMLLGVIRNIRQILIGIPCNEQPGVSV